MKALTDVLAGHEANQLGMSAGPHWLSCTCGAITPRRDDESALYADYLAHVSEAIRIWATSDDAVEKAARAIDEADDRWQHGIGTSGYDPKGPPLWLSRAALSAVFGGDES